MTDASLQDGMLQYFLSVAAQQDGNVEPRLEREAFDVKTMMVPLNTASPNSPPPYICSDVTTLMYSPLKARNETPRDNNLVVQPHESKLHRG